MSPHLGPEQVGSQWLLGGGRGMRAAGDREAPFRGPGRKGPAFSSHSVGEAPVPKIKGALGFPRGPAPQAGVETWPCPPSWSGDMGLHRTGLDRLEPVGKGSEHSREPRGPRTQIYRSLLGGGGSCLRDTSIRKDLGLGLGCRTKQVGLGVTAIRGEEPHKRAGDPSLGPRESGHPTGGPGSPTRGQSQQRKEGCLPGGGSWRARGHG